MSMLKATWTLYTQTARETAGVLPRSAPAIVFLLFSSTVELLAMMAFGNMGFAGGLIIGLLDAMLVGWYLALLHLLLFQNRQLGLSDVQETAGFYFSEVLTISFVFGIPRLILYFSYPQLVILFVPLVSLLFSPAPEMVYQERDAPLELIQRALEFMKTNWPEWLFGHVLLFAFLSLILWPLQQDAAIIVPMLAGLYGPWFDFVGNGPFGVLLLASPAGWMVSLALFVCSHLVMVFRGVLYKKLARSSRRGRAWQAKF